MDCSECCTPKSVYDINDDYKSYAVNTKCKECGHEKVRYRGYLCNKEESAAVNTKRLNR